MNEKIAHHFGTISVEVARGSFQGQESRASGGSMMDEEQIAQIEKLLERYKHVIGDSTPAREFQTFLATKEMLARNPERSIRWPANQVGVDLKRLKITPPRAHGVWLGVLLVAI